MDKSSGHPRSNVRVSAVVPAAGSGTRLGAGQPKAFVELCGVSLLRRCVMGLAESGVVDAVVAVVPEQYCDFANRELADLATGSSGGVERTVDITVVAGGLERTDSVRAGLEKIGSADIVLVHDAARCLTPVSVIRRVVAEVRAGRDAVIPAMAVVDTIKLVDAQGQVAGTPNRDDLRAVQTPQGFAVRPLLRAYAGATGIASDDAALMEQSGEKVWTVEGDPLAFKITTPADHVRAAALVAARENERKQLEVERTEFR